MPIRNNPSAFLTLEEVDALVDRALAKDKDLPAEAYAWVLGFGESRYTTDNSTERIREYVLSRWPEFRTRGKMASGRRTSNILEKLRSPAMLKGLTSRYGAAGHEEYSDRRVWAIGAGYEVIAYVYAGSMESAIAEAQVTWKWMYPNHEFNAFLVGIGGKRESDTRNGRMMLGMTAKVDALRQQAEATVKKADRLQDLLNTWAILNPDQVQAALAAG